MTQDDATQTEGSKSGPGRGTGRSAPGALRALFTSLPFALFFVSGACGLIYQVVWSRMLVLVMGNTTVAASTILASFMAGLSLGSFYWGRHVERRKGRPLLLFGFLEIGIAVIALVFSYLIRIVVPIEAWISQAAGLGYAAQILVRFCMTFPLLLAPTFLMGGTFAVLGRHIIARGGRFARSAALLYAINTAGAMAGAASAGFFLIRALGHRDSLLLAAGLNLAVGAGALLLAAWIGREEAAESPAAQARGKARPAPSRGVTNLVVIGLALSGFCGMAYEVLWTRLLILRIGNSVYSFTTILVAFLAGIALGSLLLVPILRWVKNLVALFGILQIGVAVLAFGFPFFVHQDAGTPDETYAVYLVARLPVALFLPALLMGMSFPVGARIVQSRRESVGESLGFAYAANTFGSVLGPLAAAFLFIQYLGFRNSSLLLSFLNLVVGAVILGTQIRGGRKAALVLGVVIVCIAAPALMPTDYFAKKYSELNPERELIYFHEGLETTATIFEEKGHRFLYLNGIPEVTTALQSLVTFKLMGTLPGLLHEEPKDALMITFGAGITSGAASHFVERIECVDLAAQARDIAGHFSSYNDRIIENPKLSLHHDDARHYLRYSKEQYSVIVSDATHPSSYDSWVLFTTDFYELVKGRLDDDGIFLQWIPLHGLELEDYKGIVRTFQHVFPHTSIWRIGGAFTILLATPGPLEIDLATLNERLARPDVQRSLAPAGIGEPFTYLSFFAMAEEQVRAMVGEGPLMTDDNPGHMFFSLDPTHKQRIIDLPRIVTEEVQRFEEDPALFLVNATEEEQQGAWVMKAIRENRDRAKLYSPGGV